MGHLAEALAPDAPLADLLAAWRSCPHPRLAGLIERLSPPDPSIHGIDQADTIAGLQAALAGDALAFGAALRVFPVGPLAQAQDQLDRVAVRPADPRVASRLLRLLDDPPYRTRAALPWWTAALAVLVKQADPRSAAVLAAARARMDQLFAEPMRSLVGALIDAALPDLPTTAPDLDAADTATLARLEARVPVVDTRTVAQLEAAIYAEPLDAELREVFADACLQAGEPRGEVIRLQGTPRLNTAQRTRLKQLIEAGRAAWLGPLDKVLLKSSVRFEGGFLSAATLKPKHTAHLAPLVGDPRWATVRALTLGALGSASADAYAAQATVDAAVLSPAFRALDSLAGEVQPALAIALAESATPRRLENLEVRDTWPEHRAALRAAFVEAPGLPRLRALIWRAFDAATPGAPIVGAAVLARLRLLGLSASAAGLDAWLRWWADTDLEVLRLSDVHDHREIRLERSATGYRLSARFRWPGMVIGGMRDGLMTLCEAALALAPATFEAVTLKWTRKHGPRAEQRAAVDRMIAHLAPARVSLPAG